MAVPLIGTGVAAGRGLLAYLAKRKAMRAAQKSALSQIGRYGATVPNAAKFVVKPKGASKFAKRMGIGALGTWSFLAGDEYGKRHPRVDAMERFRIPNAGRVGFAPDKGLLQIDPNTGLRTVTGVHGTVEEQKAAYFAEIANDPNAPMDQRVSALLRLETGAAYTAEEANAAAETLRARDIERLNMTQGGKQMLMDDLRNQTGAGVTAQEYYNLEKALRERTGAAVTEQEADAIEPIEDAGYTGGINTFMGMPLKEKLIESGKFLADPTGLWRKGISGINKQFGIGEGTEAKVESIRKWQDNMAAYNRMYYEAIRDGDTEGADRILRKMDSL